MGTIAFPATTSTSPLIRSSLSQLNPASRPIKFSRPSAFFRQKYSPVSFGISIKEIPARDRVIGIGKYKGRMLGSLPSSYLKWVSKNLRAGDTEEWARLADEVLGDAVYRDRIEWEMVEKILNGNTFPHGNRDTGRSNAVSELLEISGRFGWDNEDKRGWSEIDFGLLGTSRGGRIPRLAEKKNSADQLGNLKEEKVQKIENVSMGEESGGRRRERMMRRRRLQTAETDGGRGRGRERERGLPSSLQRGKEGGHHVHGNGDGGGCKDEHPTPTLSADVVQPSPFPGRQALLDKLRIHRRRPHSPNSSG